MTAPDAQPMRRSSASFGWIERRIGGEAELLVQWNHHWRAFNLVGGQQEAGESARECLVRELHEELAILEHQDYVADLQPMARLAYVATSARTHELTEYRMTLFRVEIPTATLQRIVSDPANRWLTRAEVLARQTEDGQDVSETIGRWLEMID